MYPSTVYNYSATSPQKS